MRIDIRSFAYISLAIACQAFSPSQVVAAPVSDEELQALKRDDQHDREDIQGKPWNAEITVRDHQRRERVHEMLRAGRVRTGEDFSNAALIFQHGDSPDDFRLAYSLAWTAFTILDDGKSKQFAGWLSAAAWDRLMINMGKPQRYGTQYGRDPKTHVAGTLLPFDESALTKEERDRFLEPMSK